MTTAPLTHTDLLAAGYMLPRQLPTGEWAALQKQLFTTGLFIVDSRHTWRTRWCYERKIDAMLALAKWDGKGDPPGPWIKQKPQERLNPAWAKGKV